MEHVWCPKGCSSIKQKLVDVLPKQMLRTYMRWQSPLTPTVVFKIHNFHWRFSPKRRNLVYVNGRSALWKCITYSILAQHCQTNLSLASQLQENMRNSLRLVKKMPRAIISRLERVLRLYNRICNCRPKSLLHAYFNFSSKHQIP